MNFQQSMKIFKPKEWKREKWKIFVKEEERQKKRENGKQKVKTLHVTCHVSVKRNKVLSPPFCVTLSSRTFLSFEKTCTLGENKTQENEKRLWRRPADLWKWRERGERERNKTRWWNKWRIVNVSWKSERQNRKCAKQSLHDVKSIANRKVRKRNFGDSDVCSHFQYSPLSLPSSLFLLFSSLLSFFFLPFFFFFFFFLFLFLVLSYFYSIMSFYTNFFIFIPCRRRGRRRDERSYVLSKISCFFWLKKVLLTLKTREENGRQKWWRRKKEKR